MPWITGAIIGGAGLLGGYMQGEAAKDAAASNVSAAQQAGASQEQAARIAASAGAFRPVGISTRFGTSQYTMGTDQYGNPIVTGAGYTASPEIQALQNRIAAMYGPSLGMAEQGQAAAQGLFNLGQGYLATTPQEAAQQYMANQQALLAQPRQTEEQRLAASVFGRGRAGLNVGQTGQPELYALAAARRQQDLQLAAQAEQAAQQRVSFGTGLLSQAYALPTAALSPFQAQLGLVTGMEEQAMQPLALGAQLGGRNVNPYGASAMFQAGSQAANRLYGAQQQAIGTQLAGQQQMWGTGTDLLKQYMGQLNFGSGITPRATGVAYNEMGTNPYAYTPQPVASNWLTNWSDQ